MTPVFFPHNIYLRFSEKNVSFFFKEMISFARCTNEEKWKKFILFRRPLILENPFQTCNKIMLFIFFHSCIDGMHIQMWIDVLFKADMKNVLYTKCCVSEALAENFFSKSEKCFSTVAEISNFFRKWGWEGLFQNVLLSKIINSLQETS